MQNYTNYIIGLFIVVALAVLWFSTSSPATKPAEEVTKTETPAKIADVVAENATNSEIKKDTKQEIIENKKIMQNKIIMTTSKGTITLQLNPKIAPKTVANFEKLVAAGFYDGVRFHRVIAGFMIQAGDPQSKDLKKVNAWGTGGPGYKFEDEITDPATYKTGYKRGVLAMANSGPNTNGSQFFIMHKDMALPPNYTIFGYVIAGIETVDAIAAVKVGQSDRPIEDVLITKVVVE